MAPTGEENFMPPSSVVVQYDVYCSSDIKLTVLARLPLSRSACSAVPFLDMCPTLYQLSCCLVLRRLVGAPAAVLQHWRK